MREVSTVIKKIVADVMSDECAWTPAWEFKGYESATVYASSLAYQLVGNSDDVCPEVVENIISLVVEEFRKAGCRVVWEDDKIKIFRRRRVD